MTFESTRSPPPRRDSGESRRNLRRCRGMDNPALTSLAVVGGAILMVAAIAWFVSPRARSGLRRGRTAVLVAFLVVLAIVWVFKDRA